MQAYRASKNLRAGDSSSLNFELYQQEENIADPELNTAIGHFELRATNLAAGTVIRRGDEIYVNWKIDANSLLTCSFDIPAISQTYEIANMYVPTASHRNFDGEEGSQLALSALVAAKSEVEQLERALDVAITKDAQPIRDRIANQMETLALANDADTKRMVSQEALLLRQEIYKLKHRPENQRAVSRA